MGALVLAMANESTVDTTSISTTVFNHTIKMDEAEGISCWKCKEWVQSEIYVMGASQMRRPSCCSDVR